MNGQRTVCQELKILNQMIKRFADAMLSELFDQEITDMQGRIIGFLYCNQTRPILSEGRGGGVFHYPDHHLQDTDADGKNGLISRSTVEYDARLKELRLTDKALDYAARVGQGLEEFEKTVTQGMTETERETLLTLLRKLEGNVSAAGRKRESAIC